MGNWQLTDFKPKWASENEPTFGDMPDVGYPTEAPPRLVTRVVSTDGGSSISSATLADTISITQHMVEFVAHEVIYGIDRNLADLRTIDNRVQRLARLHIEPFETGSFIIPAELTTEPIEFEQNGKERTVYAKQVLERFNAIMDGVLGSTFDYDTSIGTIRCIESLNRVLRRDAKFLEYQTMGYADAGSFRPRRFTINSESIKKVSEVRKYREEVVVRHGSLDGNVVALDFEHLKLKIRLPDNHVVKGEFLPLMARSLEGVLCKSVRLHGTIHYRKNVPVSIDAVAVNLLEDSQDKPGV